MKGLILSVDGFEIRGRTFDLYNPFRAIQVLGGGRGVSDQ
jgi:hypothetical protein